MRLCQDEDFDQEPPSMGLQVEFAESSPLMPRNRSILAFDSAAGPLPWRMPDDKDLVRFAPAAAPAAALPATGRW
jgi:hypothetical protein